MAIDSARDRIISGLKRASGLYRLLRAGWRSVRHVGSEGIRWVVPRSCHFGLPKGAFSLFEQVQRGEVEGNIFFMQQEVPVFGPESLVKRSGLRQDEFQPWPVFSAHLKNARLYGKNLVLLNEKKQACRDFMFAHCALTDESYRIPTFQKVVYLPGRWTSLVSRWDDGYWHFLMDQLPRLHAMDQFPSDTGILVRGPIREWQWELFQMLGVADRVRPTTERHLIVEELYFSSHTSMTGAYNPFAIDFLRSRLMEQGTSSGHEMAQGYLDSRSSATRRPSPNFHASSTINYQPNNRTHANGSHKLYLKRGDDWTRGIRNQDAVCTFLEARGWLIIEPEKHGVREQIELFSQADAVCAAHGSALTNLLWMKPGAQVLEMDADNFMLGAFEWLARAVGLEHHFLVFPGDHRLSFSVDLNQLRRVVEKMESKA